MNMNEKLETILNSYINGQIKQMAAQIKTYGVRKFHVDFYEAMSMEGWQIDHYAKIVYKFHLINR